MKWLKLGNSFLIQLPKLLIGLAILISSFSQVKAQENNSTSAEVWEGESCQAARQERIMLCNRAAKHCTEVDKFTAFNQIRPCAYYAQRCAQMGEEEAEYCFGEANPQVGLHRAFKK